MCLSKKRTTRMKNYDIMATYVAVTFGFETNSITTRISSPPDNGPDFEGNLTSKCSGLGMLNL